MKRYSILQERKECYKCKTTNALHIHEVYYGAKNRSKSIEDGCCVYLCPRHHNMSNEGIHYNKEFDKEVKQSMESRWLETYNKTIDDFIKRYGRNYL